MTEADQATENQWDQVDDFKWLKAGPSPNWTTLSEAERLNDGIWTETVAGRSSMSVTVAEALSKVGIRRRRGSSFGEQ
jgi:tubulin-specific chaperone C